MSGSYKPFFKVTWNTPDGKPPEHYRRKKQDATPPAKEETRSPEEELSAAPPVSPGIGESDAEAVKVDSSQDVAHEEVSATKPDQAASNFHQQPQNAGESSLAADEAVGESEDGDASISDETCWQQIAAALHDLTGDEVDEQDEQQVVKVERRNTQKLTESEEDRFLLCLTQGMSLRQAAEVVGIHHTTMVKRAKRDKAFGNLIAFAQSKAKSDPLLEVQQASRKSWRAAAWLLTYLERRDSRGGKKAS